MRRKISQAQRLVVKVGSALVTDNGSGLLADSETFNITVGEVNLAPVLAAIGNQTVDELTALSFTASATDADLPANTLSYSLDATSLAARFGIDVADVAFWTASLDVLIARIDEFVEAAAS